MEMDSSSLSESATSNATSPPAESVNGLKFGKKIYFEDHGGVGAPAKRGTGSSSSGSGSGSSRKAQGGQHQQPPRCQVEGCKVDLSDAKTYYSRHKASVVVTETTEQLLIGYANDRRFVPAQLKNSIDRKGVLNVPNPRFKFHLLPEFDQGKRSCRRRLAGHNERRRKPPSGSVLSTRHGRFSPSLFVADNSSRDGGLLVDFSAYPRHTGRDGWPAGRSSGLVTGNETAATGRSISHPWQISSQNPPPNLCMQQGSTGGTGLFSAGIPPGECFTGVAVSDSSCALSLLSNQPWVSTNRASSLAVNDLLSAEETPVAQSTAHHGAAVNHYANPWSFKNNEGSNSSHDLGQISLPFGSQLPGPPRAVPAE
ncbi:hypothetical protein OIU85_000369 [Salix viminalis]|uniref:SBP-type domain-containing protein n=1 Tax=Salix viminalis TaxID=40686 RepID=A0A9Q0ZWQ3_SALVM|nr:hypothetical protein OIU85_000369 [Salix viminalis]